MDRFKFRIPVYDNENKFVGFTNLDIEKGIVPYNYGKVHHEEKEQCTGLKDKNGNLIYEGDILKSNDTILKVFWWSELGSFAFKKEKSVFTISQQSIALCGFEIIGNIHKNPELLEDK